MPIANLPIHPVTGVRALGFTSRGPIWPVMGGNGEGGDPPQDPTPPTESPRGFPENTPIADMTTEQQLAYFKHHDRRKGDTLKAFDGITPEQAKAARDRVTELERGQLDANDRALAEARDQAAAEARSSAAEVWGQTVLDALASAHLPDEKQRTAFLSIASPDKFITNGRFDVDAATKAMQALAPVSSNGGKRTVQWGHHSDKIPPVSGADIGRAEAQKRFGTKTQK